MDVSFGILGRTAIRINDDLDEAWGSTRLRAMLATLLVHAGRTVPIETLVAWVWPEDDAIPQNPASTFHTYATRIRMSLRRLANPPSLLVENGCYRLDVDRSSIDYGCFRALMGQARAHARADNHRSAVDDVERALTLWRGRALDDLRSEPAEAWRTRVLRDEWLPANVVQVEALLELREFEQALTRLDDLRADYDNDVTLAKLRLSALYGLSRYTEATAYYLGMRRLMLNEGDEQGADDLREHHESVRRKSTPADDSRRGEPAVIPHQLPHDIPEFVGRDGLLRALDAAIQDNGDGSPGRVVVLDGMAGVGKTALAVHWGHRARHRFPGGEFFVDLRGFSDGASVAQSTVVDEFLIALGWPLGSDMSPRAKELTLKRLLATRQALVVLDNARNTGHVRDLIALLPNCCVIVTSRQQLTMLRAATGARRVHLEPMTVSEASVLLSARLGDQHALDHGQRENLARICGGLPLVITVLAQHIASRPAAHLTAFAQQLDRRQLITDIGEDNDGSFTAETLFNWSYQALGAPERRLFRLLGGHPGPDISEAAARACDGRTTPEVKRSLRILVAAHLLSQPDAFDRYRFHDLIREFARRCAEQDESPAEQAAAERRLIGHYLSVATQAHRRIFPGNRLAEESQPVIGASEPESFTDAARARIWFDRERVNLVRTVNLAVSKGHHKYAWLLVDVVGTFLDRYGYYEDCRTVRQLSVRSARAAGHRIGEASTLVGLGMVEMILGDHDSARDSLEGALRIVEEEGFERGQASTLHQLGRLKLIQGDPAKAIDFYRRCLDIAQRTRDGEALCWTHSSIAEALRILHRYDEALVHLAQSQTYAGQIGDDSARASNLVQTGTICRVRGELTDAVSYCEEAMSVVDAMPIPDLAIKASASIALAEIRNEQGATEASIRYVLDAIEMAHRTHNTTVQAQAQEVYGDIQFASGEPAGAERAWQAAIDGYEQIGNDRHTDTIRAKITKARRQSG